MFSFVFSVVYSSFAGVAACGGAQTGNLNALQTALGGLVDNITGLLTGLGVAVCVIGIVIGGLMRATAFGNERKVAQSNQAIACAVVGLVIVGLAQVAGTAIQSTICK